jgi:hypothetical protein
MLTYRCRLHSGLVLEDLDVIHAVFFRSTYRKHRVVVVVFGKMLNVNIRDVCKEERRNLPERRKKAFIGWP